MITPYFTYLMEQGPFEKLASYRLVKKFTEFHGTGRFITAFTVAPHLSICTNSILYFGHITAGA
jgi:hypothetical protein